MTDSGDPIIRRAMSIAFDSLFIHRKDHLVPVHNFLLKKKSKNSFRKVVFCDRGAGGAPPPPSKASVGLAAGIEDDATTYSDAEGLVVNDLTASKTWDGSDGGGKPPGRRPAVVHGSTITGLFEDSTDDDDEKASQDRETRFSNGAGIDFEHYVHSYIETPADKKLSEKIFASEGYAPSKALLVAAVSCFSTKKKAHFFRDGLYLCSVFAKEMSMSLSGFLMVRGWAARNYNGKVQVSYRRIGDCLRKLGAETTANYKRVSAMFDALYRALNSSDLWPEMPYEKVDRDPESQSTKTASRKRKKLDDGGDGHSDDDQLDRFFQEDTTTTMSLPTHSRVEMRDFYNQSSSFGKLLSYQQVFQLGRGAVKVCFDKVLYSQYTSDPYFMDQLFCVIFFECSTKRMMLQGKFSFAPLI